MENRLTGDYQLDLSVRESHPTAILSVRGDGHLPPKANRYGEYVYGSGEGGCGQKSQRVINSLEEIILGSEWEKLDTMANVISLVHFLNEQGLFIYAFRFKPEITNNEKLGLYWILQIKIHERKTKGHKYPRPLTHSQKRKIQSSVLQGLAQKAVKESDIEILWTT